MDKKEEAIARMEILHMLPQVVNEFRKEDRLEVSERLNKDYQAALYWTSNYEGLDEAIKKFETEYNALVYHVNLTHMEFGDCFAFLFVTDDEDAWQQERAELKDGMDVAYVWNRTAPELSEMGMIGVEPKMGGVARTW